MVERKHKIDEDSELAVKRAKQVEEDVDGDDEFADLTDDEAVVVGKSNLQPRNFNLYLETINKKILDFDFEKVCTISLSNTNVYGCLVCNKYLRGRNKDSEVFQHSINENHHVFINFHTLQFYIMPENYELDTKTTESLKEIQLLVNPTYKPNDLKKLYTDKSMCLDLNKQPYRRGFIGLNNSGLNDYSNVIIQSLSHVKSLRDFILMTDSRTFEQLNLVAKFSLVVRKLWWAHLYKPHLSTHELMALIESRSKKLFSLHSCSKPKDFLLWLLNQLNDELSGIKQSIVSKIFQGKLLVNGDKRIKFWLLTLDLPQVTLFKDGMKLTVPQFELNELIEQKKYKFVKLPTVLVICIDRMKNDTKIVGISGSKMNPSIVKFNPERLTIGDVNYRLIANVVFDNNFEDSSITSSDDNHNDHYKVQLLDDVRNEWLEINDLKFKTIEKDLLFLDQSYLQFWEKI